MKIGFCFLVKEGISNEIYWSHFFKSAKKDSYKIYVHAKTPFVNTTLENVSIDANPLETEWASISLVHATKRLIDTAFNDQCDSVVFISGDTLPLWNFKVIHRLCSETIFSLQSEDNLNQKQINQKYREHQRIRSFYQLNEEFKLTKQHMFFSIKKGDYDLLRDIRIDDFPGKEVPDEYFWSNHLLMKGCMIEDNKFIFTNDDPTKTQALSWNIDCNLLQYARSRSFLFIRKVTGFVDEYSRSYYTNILSQSNV